MTVPLAATTAFVTTSYPSHPGDAAGHFVETEARGCATSGVPTLVFAPGRAGARSHDAESRIAIAPEVVRIADGGAFGWPGMLPRCRDNPLRILGACRFVAGARRALAEAAPGRVVAHFIVPSAWPIAMDAPGALEVVAHGTDVRLLIRLGLARRVVGALLRRGARFRFVSEALLDELCGATTPSLREHATVAPCALEMDGVPDRAAARARLAVGDARLAVIVSRLIASKRVDVAIEVALSRAERVVIVGDGPERGTLAARHPRAEFVGHVSRPEALCWIAAADLLVSASLLEGAPTVVREARALGVPVLCAAAGDVRRWSEADPGIALL